METSDLDRFDHLMVSFRRVLSNERQERQRLLVLVDTLQITIQGLAKRLDRLEDAQKLSPITTSPKGTLQTRKILPLRKRPIGLKETTQWHRRPPVRPEIFEGKGIRVPWRGHYIRVRLPKPQTSRSKNVSITAVEPSATAPAPQKSPTADLFSEPRNALDIAANIRRLRQAHCHRCSGSLVVPAKTALSSDPAKFNFAASPLKPKDFVFKFKGLDGANSTPPSQAGSSSLFSFIADHLSQTSVSQKQKPPKFDFSAPPSSKDAAFNFDFVPPSNDKGHGVRNSALLGASVGTDDLIALAALFSKSSAAGVEQRTNDAGEDTPTTESEDQGAEAPRDRSREPSIELVPNPVVEASKAGGDAGNATEEEAEETLAGDGISKTVQESDDSDGSYYYDAE